MSYTDEGVKAKLNSLNETQDSIVSVAQWIMFHRRQADRTASLWLARLQESNIPKRLNLIYLANEVVQQSRARSKTDFLYAFEPLMPEATALAYKGASQEVQGKIRRVAEVWKQRSIFDPHILEQTDKRLEEIDKHKGGKSIGGGGARLGGNLFGGSGGVAPELDGLNKIQIALSKADAASKTPVSAANTGYEKMTDPSTPVPSAPVRAAKLRGLVNDLRAAQGAVEASIKARRELLSGLERLIESNRAKLQSEEMTSSELADKVDGMETTIRHVEDSIMHGREAPSLNGTEAGVDWSRPDPERPETEGFTPPPPDVEEFTPRPQDVLEAVSEGLIADSGGFQDYQNPTADLVHENSAVPNEPTLSYVPPPAMPEQRSAMQAGDILSAIMSQGQVRQASDELPAVSTGGNPGDPRLKRRKMDHQANNTLNEEIFAGMDEAGVTASLLGR